MGEEQLRGTRYIWGGGGDRLAVSLTHSRTHTLSSHRQQSDMQSTNQSTVQTTVASGQTSVRFWNSTARPTWPAPPIVTILRSTPCTLSALRQRPDLISSSHTVPPSALSGCYTCTRAAGHETQRPKFSKQRQIHAAPYVLKLPKLLLHAIAWVTAANDWTGPTTQVKVEHPFGLACHVQPRPTYRSSLSTGHPP